MFDIIRNPAWVAQRSIHNKGGAIDLTLAKEVNGKLVELDMGAEFDLFSEESEYNYSNLTREQKNNRFLLRDVMTKAGFEPYNGEWWHFSVSGNDMFLDLPL